MTSSRVGLSRRAINLFELAQITGHKFDRHAPGIFRVRTSLGRHPLTLHFGLIEKFFHKHNHANENDKRYRRAKSKPLKISHILRASQALTDPQYVKQSHRPHK
jgi:hypothetical protein